MTGETPAYSAPIVRGVKRSSPRKSVPMRTRIPLLFRSKCFVQTRQRERKCRTTQIGLQLFAHIPHALGFTIEKRTQFSENISLAPVLPFQVLFPLKGRNHDTAGVRKNIGNDGNLLFKESVIRVGRRGTVGEFEYNFCFDVLRVLFGYLILERGGYKYVTGKFEELFI